MSRPSLMPKITEIPSLLSATPSMFRDLAKRKYRQIPLGTLTGGFLGFLYILNPLDLIPDALPILGVIDDTMILGVFLTLLGRDVKKYLAWKNPHDPKATRKT
jgi:uncharacterized membrane protein YkvA (DUF1232 family)